MVGSGGREHALVWKIAQSKLAGKVFCAPGNGGMCEEAECVDIKAGDIPGTLAFAKKEKIDLTVVGPEAPLAAGIADEFSRQGLRIFAPDKRAARLEASKVFAKELMAKYGVPTARFKVFDNADEAKRHIERLGGACVVKADGLAQGKGVVVAGTVEEAHRAVDSMMRERMFGEAGNKVIVEECLQGQEASILVLTDSKQVIPLASSQDHKRAFDGDTGPNTGGMGAYSPAPVVTETLLKEILDAIVYRTIDGLAKEGIEYRGVLYAGVMITKDGPKALEFNVRFGDPETQAVLPRMKSDLVEVMLAVAERKLSKFSRFGGLSWDSRPCVCVVCASGGYPGKYEKNKEILGLGQVKKMKDVVVFHAGTRFAVVNGEKKILTEGGRVLGVTGLGATIQDALDKTYKAVGEIHFEGMHFRRDIARKALKEGL